MSQIVLAHFACDRWTWSDHAHIAEQHVEELGQLIQRILTQESADLGDARVVGHLEEDALTLVHGGDR